MTRRPGSPTRIGLYTPKRPGYTPEQMAMAEKMYPRPQVDFPRELAQLAIVRAALDGVQSTDSTPDNSGVPTPV